MGFNFKNSQEEVSNSSSTKERTLVSSGIHDFSIEKVEKITINSATPWDKIVVTFKCIKTLVGEESKGLSISYDILFPRNQEEADKTGSRLIHIFNKTAGSNKIESITKFIQEQSIDSIDDMLNMIGKFAGKSVRLKITKDIKTGKYPAVPLYLSGYAEATDVAETKLVFDASTEQAIWVKDDKKPAQTKVETPTKEDSDLPF